MTVAATETGLSEATRRLNALAEELRVENARHAKEVERLGQELDAAQQHRDLVLAGLPLGVIELAESVVEVYKRENVSVGEGGSVVRDAISDIAEGAPRLRRGYFGTKTYDRFAGQRYDGDGSYSSGGPRHGTQVFRVGLRPELREDYLEGSTRKKGREMTEAERDAAIAYLHVLLAEAGK